MKYPFKSLLLAATVLAAASCAKDDTQSGGEETAGPVIVNASPAAIGGEIILKLKTEASGIVEKSRAQGVSKGSGIDEIDRILNTVNTVRFERLFPDGGRFEERTRREGLHLWYYAKYDPSVPTSEMASLLSSCKDIEIIEYSLAAETSDHRRAASPAAGAQSVPRAIADEVRNVPSRSTRANARSRCNGTTTTRETSSRRRASWAPTPTYTPPGSSRRAIPT